MILRLTATVTCDGKEETVATVERKFNCRRMENIAATVKHLLLSVAAVLITEPGQKQDRIRD